MNAWNHLPNARYIDRIIESVKSHPEIWEAARDATLNATLNAALNAAMDAARNEARNAALDAAMNAALGAARYAARYAARGAAWYATWAAIAALIAYDDASKYLEMSSGHLRIWAILSGDPAAVLLLLAVIAFERISELELA
jgi:hypothetical protein